MVIASTYLPLSSKTHARSSETLGSQIMHLTSVSILTRFLLTAKLLGYFPVNLNQFAASGNKRDVNRSSGSCARALERHEPECGDRTRCLCHQAPHGDKSQLY
eukprot:sb/3478254/